MCASSAYVPRIFGKLGPLHNFGSIGLTPIESDVTDDFIFRAGSSAGEHRPYKPGVTGSNPVPPTRF